jgi:methionyl-tRNA formyltransferase
MRAIFLGTPEFAARTLERMIAAKYDVVEVVTQPDRPSGRKQTLTPSSVKLTAIRHGIPVYQPERIRRAEAVEHLRALSPDVMVVVGYGQIIPQSVIDIPPYGIVNVHASLLPELRGAAPIQWSVVRGYERTGVTTMRIDAGLDTGDMLRKAETDIGPEETAVELGARLAEMGADLLIATLSGLADGSIVAVKQDSTQATLAPILKKEDGRIDWTQPAREIHNRVRGLLPWPAAYTSFRGQSLHVWKARVVEAAAEMPGKLLPGRKLIAGCGESTALELLEVQIEGRKRISGEAFANGQHLSENEFLGAPEN